MSWRDRLRPLNGTGLAAIVVGTTIGLTAPVHADVDTDFANQLHTYGIYGQKDYYAWLAKIACKRLRTGLDANANESLGFVHTNLPRTTTQVQTSQFLATALGYYCPDKLPVLEADRNH
jgi:Protein of unknown function (DUF732)